LFGLYETGRRRTKSEKKKEKKKKVDKLISKSRNGQRRGYLHFYTVNKSYKVLFREQRVSMVWGVIIRERERERDTMLLERRQERVHTSSRSRRDGVRDR
jgi:hypothetical protein